MNDCRGLSRIELLVRTATTAVLTSVSYPGFLFALTRTLDAIGQSWAQQIATVEEVKELM